MKLIDKTRVLYTERVLCINAETKNVALVEITPDPMLALRP
jgi:hypothetical protein